MTFKDLYFFIVAVNYRGEICRISHPKHTLGTLFSQRHLLEVEEDKMGSEKDKL